MPSPRVTLHLNAPRERGYNALVDANAVATWMVPDGMISQVHFFEGGEDGAFRISLTYTRECRRARRAPIPTPMTAGSYNCPMIITFTLADRDNGTALTAMHEGLPSGLNPADAEAGWRSSLAKFQALVESG